MKHVNAVGWLKWYRFVNFLPLFTNFLFNFFFLVVEYLPKLPLDKEVVVVIVT